MEFKEDEFNDCSESEIKNAISHKFTQLMLTCSDDTMRERFSLDSNLRRNVHKWMWKVTGDSTSGSTPYVNHGAVTVRFAGQVVASYIEYSYIEKSARPVVRRIPEAQGTVSIEEYRRFKSKLYI